MNSGRKNHVVMIVGVGRACADTAGAFDPLKQNATKNPDLIIFVMDSSIWQAANDQTLAFIESAKVGAVIITKMDGRGGALIEKKLLSVTSNSTPHVFPGMGDIAGFAEKIKELMSMIPGFNNVNMQSFDTQQLRKLYEKRI
ncbi:hypothetical protein SELMODRAFT_407935 [Selaginella moellendorffii]|uniref:SRP54-type proteins GTP-binding domain-containing protein n=1 Tax=Selaginella moellendorffii TaxID=88036 RepID=D8R588_SELML|nr:hypothetical protein SELMODRAFT_407935 [Selaginella moellendorffii]